MASVSLPFYWRHYNMKAKATFLKAGQVAKNSLVMSFFLAVIAEQTFNATTLKWMREATS